MDTASERTVKSNTDATKEPEVGAGSVFVGHLQSVKNVPAGCRKAVVTWIDQPGIYLVNGRVETATDCKDRHSVATKSIS